MSDTDKLKLATFAIRHTLFRIRDEEEVRYHAGVGTETFSRLCSAYAALTGDPLDALMDDIIPGASGIRHRTVEEILEDAE